jgi:hypothetical protein
MKIKITLLALALITLYATARVDAQCTHDPRVTGDTLLCPNEGGLLTTQAADSYQWYKREYGSGTTTLISGETAQSIVLTSNDVLYYFSVDATLDSCTERSPEVLVDGLAFLLPYVVHTGDFTTGGNGESIICTGDTMYLTLGLPYDTLITWFESGNVIPGANSPTLTVTAAGIYTCEGAPSICPSFLQPLGVNIEVVEINCGVGSVDGRVQGISIFPNPAVDRLTVRSTHDDLLSVRLYDLLGQSVLQQELSGHDAILDVAALPQGLYQLQVETARGMENRTVIVR